VPIVAHWRIVPTSNEQHEQFDILRGPKSFNIRSGFIKQNENFEKSQEFKGQSEKFKTQ
jgi:hypothetical protein